MGTPKLRCLSLLLTGAAVLAGQGATAPPTAAAEPRQPGAAEVRTTNHNDPHLHLFVDDEEVDQVEDLRRVLNRPAKHPAPVLAADKPWEGERAQAWGSVVVEPDGLLRLWYFAFN